MAFVDPEEFAAAVRTSETQTGFVIEFMPEQTPEQMLLRATARHAIREKTSARRIRGKSRTACEYIGGYLPTMAQFGVAGKMLPAGP